MCFATIAWVGSAAGLQPVRSPSSLTNRKRAGPDPFGPVTTNPVVGLNACPVGAPPGIDTVRAALVTGFAPPPAYSVEVLVPLLATHSGLVGDRASPHALTASGSVIVAWPGWSETRSLSTNVMCESAWAALPMLSRA